MSKEKKPFNIYRYIGELALVKKLIEWAKKSSMPGFFKVPIYDVVVFVGNEIKRFDVVTRANSMTFSFFLSLFPSLILLLSLLPFFSEYFFSFLPEGGEDFFPTLEAQILSILPGNAGEMVFDTLDDLANNRRPELLSIGFLLAMYFASNGMMSMMRAFEKAHTETFKKRPPVKKRIVGITLTFILFGLLFASSILLILGNTLINIIDDAFELDFIIELSISGLRYLTIIILFYFGIAFIYRFGVPTKKKISIFSPGTTLASVLCIVISLAFSFYVDNFNTYNKLYGSIGTIMALMLWIQMNCIALIIGFELNASIAVNRDLLAQLPDEEV
ncbi:MAG: YihY/virulence factor BrkB family protein [Saprospiraceae bacterium]|nr:YihY/virulence factor BrkB family protein [Saprospiraceae bacterium]